MMDTDSWPLEVLLVDDERDFVDTLCARLRTRGVDVRAVYSGGEALGVLRGGAPRVMVLDLKMPGIDGLEVLRRMREQASPTEVIVLTGHASDREMGDALRLGAQACLRKPVDIEHLKRMIEKAGREADRSRKEAV